MAKITKKMIKNGILDGVVHFVIDPNLEHGTVCQIGDYWFYFGGQTAEDENPAEFLRNAGMEEAISDVAAVLEQFETDSPLEHAYYYAVLNPMELIRKVFNS